MGSGFSFPRPEKCQWQRMCWKSWMCALFKSFKAIKTSGRAHHRTNLLLGSRAANHGTFEVHKFAMLRLHTDDGVVYVKCGLFVFICFLPSFPAARELEDLLVLTEPLFERDVDEGREQEVTREELLMLAYGAVTLNCFRWVVGWGL